MPFNITYKILTIRHKIFILITKGFLIFVTLENEIIKIVMFENYPIIFKILFFFVGSFVVTYLLIPKIVSIAHDKQLLVKPNKRSSHQVVTPNFGGVAFFVSFIIMFSFLSNEIINSNNNLVIPAVTVLFVVGLKDDLVNVSPRTKLIGQGFALLLILISGKLIINNLHGFLGIYEISPLIMMPLIIFFMIGLINSYNLIDGADGLAASLGLVIMGVYAYVFYNLNDTFCFLTTFIIMGSLLAFLKFNLSTDCKKKIFMGDTGSLFVGFIIVLLTLKLLSIPKIQFIGTPLSAENLPVIIGGILFILFFDTTRVILIRFFNNKPILYPDRNHIHHILLDSGFSHLQTSIIIATLSLIITITIMQLAFLLNSYWMFGIILMIYGGLFTFFYFLKLKVDKLKEVIIEH